MSRRGTAEEKTTKSDPIYRNRLVNTLALRNPQTIPTGGQNFFEYVLEFIRDVSKTQIGEEYGPWVPFIGSFLDVKYHWMGYFLLALEAHFKMMLLHE